MRHTAASLSRVRPAPAGVADLDVTPVLNMFIILIPFLISMTAFTHLATHEFSLPGNEGPGWTTGPEQLPLTVAVGTAGLLVAEGEVVLVEFSRRDGRLSLEELAAVVRERMPARVVLAVDEPIATAEVVACLDACREAGCLDLGLAAGTGLVLSGEVDR